MQLFEFDIFLLYKWGSQQPWSNMWICAGISCEWIEGDSDPTWWAFSDVCSSPFWKILSGIASEGKWRRDAVRYFNFSFSQSRLFFMIRPRTLLKYTLSVSRSKFEKMDQIGQYIESECPVVNRNDDCNKEDTSCQVQTAKYNGKNASWDNKYYL